MVTKERHVFDWGGTSRRDAVGKESFDGGRLLDLLSMPSNWLAVVEAKTRHGREKRVSGIARGKDNTGKSCSRLEGLMTRAADFEGPFVDNDAGAHASLSGTFLLSVSVHRDWWLQI